MTQEHPTPWRVEPANTRWKGHIVDANGHNVIPSVEMALAHRIVNDVNEMHALRADEAFLAWKGRHGPKHD